MLSPGEVERLASTLVDLRERTGVHMAVLVIETTGGESIDRYSMDVAERWKGGGAALDRGLLLTVAIKDRASRLEVGQGLEGLINDAAAGRIIRGMRPGLQSGDYARGLADGIARVVERTAHVRPGGPLMPWHTNVVLWALVVLGLGFAVGFATRSVVVRVKRWRWAVRSGLWAASAAAVTLLFGGGYLLGFFVALGLGVLCRRVLCMVIGGIAGLAAILVDYGFSHHEVGSEATLAALAIGAKLMLVAFMVDLLLVMPVYMAWFFKPEGGGQTRWSSSGSSSSYSSDSSDSSSSSPSSSSSSSSSNTSWGGDGGSFGGGGASDSW